MLHFTGTLSILAIRGFYLLSFKLKFDKNKRLSWCDTNRNWYIFHTNTQTRCQPHTHTYIHILAATHLNNKIPIQIAKKYSHRIAEIGVLLKGDNKKMWNNEKLIENCEIYRKQKSKREQRYGELNPKPTGSGKKQWYQYTHKLKYTHTHSNTILLFGVNFLAND